MKVFSNPANDDGERKRNVRRIVVIDGLEGEMGRGGLVVGRDWVYLMNECFDGLEEVEFRFVGGGGMGFGFEGWWSTVVDAVREGKRRRGRLVLRCWVGGVGCSLVC